MILPSSTRMSIVLLSGFKQYVPNMITFLFLLAHSIPMITPNNNPKQNINAYVMSPPPNVLSKIPTREFLQYQNIIFFSHLRSEKKKETGFEPVTLD